MFARLYFHKHEKGGFGKPRDITKKNVESVSVNWDSSNMASYWFAAQIPANQNARLFTYGQYKHARTATSIGTCTREKKNRVIYINPPNIDHIFINSE